MFFSCYWSDCTKMEIVHVFICFFGLSVCVCVCFVFSVGFYFHFMYCDNSYWCMHTLILQTLKEQKEACRKNQSDFHNSWARRSIQFAARIKSRCKYVQNSMVWSILDKLLQIKCVNVGETIFCFWLFHYIINPTTEVIIFQGGRKKSVE